MVQTHPIVLFDGICNYCNSWVNFAIRNDQKSLLRFTPLQSPAGIELRKKYEIGTEVDSVILIENGKVFKYSDAALRITRYLNWPAKALYALKIFPAFLRQPVYKWIAKNRYKWFGKKEVCMVPTQEVKDRFL